MDEIALSFCLCGCGARVKRPTSKFLQGHHSRVNNVSKRPEIREKRREVFNRLHAEGKLGNPWNKGLTKEIDSRVASNCLGLKNWLNSDLGKKKSSDKMKKLWKIGSIVPLTGPDHPAWKGGISSITQRMRGSHQMYKLWKYPILCRDGFRCQTCKRGSIDVQLVVHHNVELFTNIVQQFLPPDLHQLSWDEETDIIKKVVDYHVDSNVSGITLCYDCHEIVHAKPNSSDED